MYVSLAHLEDYVCQQQVRILSVECDPDKHHDDHSKEVQPKSAVELLGANEAAECDDSEEKLEESDATGYAV